jgi:hypothetical protein
MTNPMLDPMYQLARIDAAADLAMTLCPHCKARREVLAMVGELPRAIGVTHEVGCPEFLPD